MKLTKFEHACLVLEKEGTTLVIDPGNFSPDFIMPRHVDGVIITHEHPDHLDPTLLNSITKAHPKASIIAHESITSQFMDSPVLPVAPGQSYTVGAFALRFFGGDHASIDSSIQTPPNLGVLIDEHLYYPGDSWATPEGYSVRSLALPVSAPWLSFSACADFLRTVKPQFAFPTHDHILSSDGRALVDRLVSGVASAQGTSYKRLDGSTVELA